MFKGRDYLPPIVLQLVGLAAFVFFCGFWAFTGRIASPLLASSGTLYGIGLVQQASQTLRKAHRDADPPVPPTPLPTEEGGS